MAGHFRSSHIYYELRVFGITRIVNGSVHIVQVVHAVEKMISDMLQNTLCNTCLGKVLYVRHVMSKSTGSSCQNYQVSYGRHPVIVLDELLKPNSSEVIKLPAQPTGLLRIVCPKFAKRLIKPAVLQWIRYCSDKFDSAEIDKANL